MPLIKLTERSICGKTKLKTTHNLQLKVSCYRNFQANNNVTLQIVVLYIYFTLITIQNTNPTYSE